MNQQRLTYLIQRHRKGEATKTEFQELNDWYSSVDYGEAPLEEWLRDENGMDNITGRMFLSFGEKVKERKLRFFRVVALRIAAAAAILLIAFGIFFIIRKPASSQMSAKIPVPPINPGTTLAVLTLSNGSKVVLNSQQTGRIGLQNGVVITKKRNGLLVYTIASHSNTLVNGKTVYNTIETPRGGEYQVQLPDGTNVWLNAASKLTYPTQFDKKERIVKLTGEAYFEVAHNPHQPFHVLFGNEDVKVLGTHFNINAYPDEADSKTTLLQGSITLTNTLNHQSVLVLPGQQAAYTKGMGHIALYTVNTAQVISWKNGYFQFDNMNIALIMKALSRWYDINVKYEHVDLTETYGGTFSRDANLNDILENITALGKIRFVVADRTIIVENKKGGL